MLRRTKLRTARGFTLAELLIVVAIIAILTAIAVPTFTSALEKSRVTVCNYNVAVIERSYKVHELMMDGYTLESVLMSEYAGGKGMCPSKGVYTAKYDTKTKTYHIYCSVHGKVEYKFNFATTDQQTVTQNLTLLLQGIPM